MIVQHHDSDYLLKLISTSSTGSMRKASSARSSARSRSTPTFSGQPHRIKYLEQIYDYVNRHEGVLHWNGEQILDWYRGVAKIEAAA